MTGETPVPLKAIQSPGGSQGGQLYDSPGFGYITPLNFEEMETPMAIETLYDKDGSLAPLQGKTVAIPGNINKLLSKLPRFVSRRTATAVIRRIQEKNRAF